ncbi:ubiquitin carboxyl-terminal hydrolase 8 [Diachasma alloeum]|uniref:ubiquitin carboxyl-terminal hydrolase 8 n=1 Tax=Diachasma alloeum TaxID=454923 RepID=UPI0007384C62|nr:ubiquitin carboxyl-terminal hydrolase 8 [Diachasma alloeum]
MSFFIKCVELLNLMKSRTEYFTYLESGQLRPGMRCPREPSKYSIFDVRPSADFHASRITHKEVDPIEVCLNIDPDFITPQTTGESLESLVVGSTEDRTQQTLIRHRDTHHVDVIVLVDWGSTEDTVTRNNRLVALRTILTKKDQGHSPPRHLILEGGFREWLLTYPEFTTNSEVIAPEDWTPEKLSQAVEVPIYFEEPSLTLPEYPDYEPSPQVDVTPRRHKIVTKVLELLSELEELLREQKKMEQLSVAKTKEILQMTETNIDCGQSYGDEARKLNEQLKDVVKRIGEKEVEIKKGMEKIGKEKIHWMFDDRVRKEKIEQDIKNLRRQIARLGKMKTNLTMQIISRPRTNATFDISDIRPASEDIPPASSTLQDSSPLRRPAPEPGLSQEKSPQISLENTPMEVDLEPPSQPPPKHPLTSRDEMRSVRGKTLPGTTGLKNPESYICYANSIIQCLSHTSQMKDYFVDNFENVEGEVTHILHRVMKMLWSGQYKSFSIEVLREKVGELKPTFNNKNHQDAQEFLTELLQILHEELKEEKSAEDGGMVKSPQEAMDNVLDWKYSIISRTFYAQTRAFIRCETCGSKSEKKQADFDAFTTLIVSLPEGDSLDLKECIDNSLDQVQSRDCAVCGGTQPARVVQEFTQLPPVLIVALNRFMKTPDKDEIRKNETPVSYPTSLEMFIGKKDDPEKKCTRYELQGVCRHSGSLAHGHYYSYCRLLGTESWYKFNDSVVQCVELTDATADKKGAYVLFYIKSENAPGTP